MLGRGNGRMEGKIPSVSLPAEGKAAIVNKIDLNMGRSTAGNVPPSLPLRMQPPYMQPPTRPEIQTGFLPVLPTYGGFKPIPDPSLSMRHPSSANVGNVKRVETFNFPKNVVTMASPKSYDLFDKNNSKNHSLDIVVEKLNFNTSIVKATENVGSTPLFSSKFQQIDRVNNGESTNSTKFKQKQETTSVLPGSTHKNITESLFEAVTVVQETTTDAREELTLIPEAKVPTYTTKINKTPERTTTTEFVPIITTEEPEIITTSNPKYIATVEVVKNSSSGIFKSIEVDKKYEFTVEKNSEAPLSTSLVAKNNHTQFKQGGRSTITKVSSPHSNQSLRPVQTPNVSNPLPHRESKSNYDYSTNPTTEQTSNDDTNWYFANYNKTNLEPYVARITNTNKAEGRFQSVRCLQLVLVVLYIDIIM